MLTAINIKLTIYRRNSQMSYHTIIERGYDGTPYGLGSFDSNLDEAYRILDVFRKAYPDKNVDLDWSGKYSGGERYVKVKDKIAINHGNQWITHLEEENKVLNKFYQSIKDLWMPNETDSIKIEKELKKAIINVQKFDSRF
jgi:hypothetical protein